MEEERRHILKRERGEEGEKEEKGDYKQEEMAGEEEMERWERKTE